MKILVTGAAGYIGSITVGVLLDAGHEVLAFDDLSCGVPSLMGYGGRRRFGFVRGDVRDGATVRAALRTSDAIIHLAAIVGMPACDRDPVRARSVNVEAVRFLMRRLRSKEQRVIFPNTNSGYGMAPGVVCTEETPLAPLSIYARLKAEAEAIVLAEPNTVSLRLATVFGLSPRMRRDLLVNDFVWRALKERRIEVYEGAAMRNYAHVVDVAEAFKVLLHPDGQPWGLTGVFNFGNDKANLSKKDLAAKVAGHFELDGARSVEVVEGYGADPDKRNYIVSSAKLAAAGIKAKYGLDLGIRELIGGYLTCPELYA